MRLDGSRTAFGVGGLHAKEHEPRALHRAPFGAGRDANAFVEGLRFEPEPLTLDRLDMLRAPDQHHIVCGASQHAAVEQPTAPAPITAIFISKSLLKELKHR